MGEGEDYVEKLIFSLEFLLKELKPKSFFFDEIQFNRKVT